MINKGTFYYMETYAENKHLKLIPNTASFFSLTLTFFHAQTNKYFVIFFSVAKVTYGVQGIMSLYAAIKKAQCNLCFKIYLTFIRLDYSILLCKEFYAHNSQVKETSHIL